MASETKIEMTPPGVNGMDYAEHEATYALFTGLVKWGVILLVVIMALMAIFLV